jgi:dTDP-4-dehydrorhamnose 3,5-epimerase
MDQKWTQVKPGQSIQGVFTIPKRKICDERGAIFHMLRRDDPEFKEFGEIYFSKVYSGVVKAWHIHSKMTLNYLVVVGSVKLVLFDDRKDSPTRFSFQEIMLDESDSRLAVVPPLVWNGFKGLGNTASIVANCASHPHDPEEISRKPYNDPYFAYDWSQRHG